jgi:hypothetical protein
MREVSADTLAQLAQAMDPAQPVTFVEHGPDGEDVYKRGTALLVVPGLFTSMPPMLLAALRVRRTCDLSGRCPACDACITLASTTVEHEADCVATDDNLAPLLRAWRRDVGHFARGGRIHEDP